MTTETTETDKAVKPKKPNTAKPKAKPVKAEKSKPAKAKKEKPVRAKKTDVGNQFDSVKFAHDLIQYREKQQISSKALAQKAGVSKTAIFDAEVGSKVPGGVFLAKLLPLLGCNFERYLIKNKIIAG
jgi:ribosome-binding protein aMBF1 (putative translation factor)